MNRHPVRDQPVRLFLMPFSACACTYFSMCGLFCFDPNVLTRWMWCQHMVGFTFGICWQNTLPKGNSEGELQWTYCSPGTLWPLPAKSQFSITSLAEGKGKAP